MQYTRHAYFKNIAAWEAHTEMTAEELGKFTQHERAFVLNYLVDTLGHLTAVNCDCLLDGEQYFMRLQDALEVADNIRALYSKLDEDACTMHFTLEEAAYALCSYDTEYRECIQEQFEDATNEAVVNKRTDDADYATLAVRLFNAY